MNPFNSDPMQTHRISTMDYTIRFECCQQIQLMNRSCISQSIINTPYCLYGGITRDWRLHLPMYILPIMMHI